MLKTTPFEANLLRLLHFFFGQLPKQQANQILESKLEIEELSKKTLEVIKDTIVKGCVLTLAGKNSKFSGWKKERYLKEGRIWERNDDLSLTFSENTLNFLLWISGKKEKSCKFGKQTVGDLLFLYLAYSQLRGEFLKKLHLNTHGLIWLTFPDDYAKSGLEGEPYFDPWLSGVGATILEVSQPVLADCWTQVEINKSQLTIWQQMRDLGAMQEYILNIYFKKLEEAKRYDLARFLLITAKNILPENIVPQLWCQGIKEQATRLADRNETYRGALAFLRSLSKLHQWAQKARLTGYLDEEYKEMQLFLLDWEKYEGDLLIDRANAIIRYYDPMGTNKN